MTTRARRRSQGNKGMPYLTNHLRSQLSGPENETNYRLSLEPLNPSVGVMTTTEARPAATLLQLCRQNGTTSGCAEEKFLLYSEYSWHSLIFLSHLTSLQGLAFAAVVVHTLSKTHFLADEISINGISVFFFVKTVYKLKIIIHSLMHSCDIDHLL